MRGSISPREPPQAKSVTTVFPVGRNYEGRDTRVSAEESAQLTCRGGRSRERGTLTSGPPEVKAAKAEYKLVRCWARSAAPPQTDGETKASFRCHNTELQIYPLHA